MKTVIINLCLSLLLMGCGRDLIPYEKPIFPAISKLSYTILCDSTLFNYPSKLLAFDSLLIVRASDRISNFHIYNSKNGEKIRSFYQFGRGPAEGVNPSNLVHLGGSEFVTQEGNLRKIVFVDFDKLLKNDEKYFSEKKITMENNLNAFMTDYYSYRGNNQFFGNGLGGTSSRFQVIDVESEENVIHLYNTYPQVIDEDDEYNSVIFKYASSVALSPDGKKFVTLTSIGGIAETFDIESDTMKLRVCKGFDKPVYVKLDNSSPWLTSTDDTTYGFRDVFATNDFIYAIYMGAKDREEINETIVVFDWDLNPIIQYELKDQLLKFALDRNTGSVYGIIQNLETAELKIIKFDEQFVK